MTLKTLVFRIAETSVPGVFQLELERLAKCGGRTKYEKDTICKSNLIGQCHWQWVRTIINYQMRSKNYVLLWSNVGLYLFFAG